MVFSLDSLHDLFMLHTSVPCLHKTYTFLKVHHTSWGHWMHSLQPIRKGLRLNLHYDFSASQQQSALLEQQFLVQAPRIAGTPFFKQLARSS
jgi:hypothetical protein